MPQPATDIWAQWLLHRRHGGDKQHLKATLDHLYPIRDKVLANARLQEGGTLLDVGCGDGLIAFEALRTHPTSKVIFTDISQDLLNHAASLARQMQVADRCEFRRAAVQNLAGIEDTSVDAVTVRSVLIYVAEKQQAFDELSRILKPGGRLSMFEPINRFGEPQPEHMFWGFDVTPIAEIAAKVKTVYLRLQPLDSDPMMNFDERDLVKCAEAAGFTDIHLDLEVEIKPLSEVPQWNVTWESFMRSAGNPRIPTLEEAMGEVLTPQEAEAFCAYMRPLVESKRGTMRSALAYLTATR